MFHMKHCILYTKICYMAFHVIHHFHILLHHLWGRTGCCSGCTFLFSRDNCDPWVLPKRKRNMNISTYCPGEVCGWPYHPAICLHPPLRDSLLLPESRTQTDFSWSKWSPQVCVRWGLGPQDITSTFLLPYWNQYLIHRLKLKYIYLLSS